jgi:hypothetical protein
MTSLQESRETVARAATRNRGVSPLIIMAGAAALVVLSICAAGMTVWQMYEQVDRETRANLGKLALVIADQTSRSFQAVDLVLADVASRISEGGLNMSNDVWSGVESQSAHEFLADRARDLPQIGNLILIAADGSMVNHSVSWPIPRVSVEEREQFRRLRDDNDSSLFISEPVRNKLDGAWAVYLARRINGPQGDFRGVVQASVRLDHFVKFYRAIDSGEGSAIALWRRDAVLLARYPLAELQTGRSIGSEQLFGEMDKYVDRGGIWRLSPVDGVPRYVAFGTVRGFPLLVATSLTEEVAMGPWKRHATILLVGVLFAVTGILVLACAHQTNPPHAPVRGSAGIAKPGTGAQQLSAARGAAHRKIGPLHLGYDRSCGLVAAAIRDCGSTGKPQCAFRNRGFARASGGYRAVSACA